MLMSPTQPPRTTPRSTWTQEDLDLLLSLNDSELEDWLRPLPKQTAAAVLISLEKRIEERSQEPIQQGEQLSAVTSPRAFRKALLIDHCGEMVVLDSVLDPWQRTDYEVLDAGWGEVAGWKQETDRPAHKMAYLERPKGHSKTTDLAVMVLWVMYASRRNLNGIAAAASKEQAQKLRDAVLILCRLNPWLGKYIQVNQFEVRNITTGSEFKILASDESTTQGPNPDFVIMDEVTHWKKRELFDTIFAAAGKRPNCMVVIISNAGDDEGWGWHWEIREIIRNDPTWYFHRLEGPQASWQTKASLDAQRKLLTSNAFRRLWLNQWTSGSENGIDPQLIEEAAAKLSGPWKFATPPAYDACIAAIDLGIRRDHSAFVVMGINIAECKIALVASKQWIPSDYPNSKINLADVRLHVIAECKRLNVIGMAYDPSQAELLAEDVAKAGTPAYAYPFTPKNCRVMTKTLLNCLNRGMLELYRDPILIQNLHAFKIIEKGMNLKLEATRTATGGHCDLGTALVISLPWCIGTIRTHAPDKLAGEEWGEGDL